LPHSEIFGSQEVCRLPEAYRRLPRPSSPPTAKAFTVCTYSLDHITPSSLYPDYSELHGVLYYRASCANAVVPGTRLFQDRRQNTFKLLKSKDRHYIGPRMHTGFNVHTPSDQGRPRDGGARRDRTDDLLLAKQALSQLSYGPVDDSPDAVASRPRINGGSG
jgi:hypothetical protein